MPKIGRCHCENRSQDGERKGTADENSSKDTDKVDIANGKLTIDRTDSISDTQTLARLDRENQGPWECEYSYGGEADLHQHYDKCDKNPGHKNFIPVDKFCIDDLPEDYRDKDVVYFIRAVSDLTVRVTVKYVSDKRPASFPGSYKRCKDKGQPRIRVGTGWVGNVNFSVREQCRCKDCQNSSTPETNFATIHISTAAHMVFDDLEAEQTTCHLFFDREGIPEKCRGVITLTGMSFVFSDVIEDICFMTYYTHDLNLARRLKKTVEKMMELNLYFCFKTPHMSKCKQSPDIPERQPLLLIVSHPHGCSKQVSLGRWTSADTFNNTIISFLYNTPTCPGSSGARVCVLPEFAYVGFQMIPISCLEIMPTHRAHSGVSDGQLGVNICHITEVTATPLFISVEILQLNKGPWADNFFCVEDGDQNQHCAACEKNPGHRNFFPVEKFSMENLPPFYQNDEVMKLVKLTSDLTVRVSVKYVSENRPETVPGTDIPYPWFNNRGSSNLTRVGTGWIETEHFFLSPRCRCKECKNAEKPKVPVYIVIRTAAHLVYDELEAENTTCHLFFHSGETPDACTNVVTLTDGYYISKKIEFDTCKIVFYTHDRDLVRRLRKLTETYQDTLDSISKFVRKKATENNADEVTQEHPLHMVISHPHGCAKQVSIGCCGNPGNADREGSQCSHASIVCPGSSGAPVIELSRELLYPVL